MFYLSYQGAFGNNTQTTARPPQAQKDSRLFNGTLLLYSFSLGFREAVLGWTVVITS